MEIRGNNICINGKIIDKKNILPDDGYATLNLYEVVRVVKNVPIFLQEHIARLNRSALKVNNKYILDNMTINHSILKYMSKCNFTNGNIIILLSSTSYCFAVHFIPHRYPSEKAYEEGVKAETCQVERTSPTIKQMDVNTHVKKEIAVVASRPDIYEVLLVNNSGYITEGSKSNLFFIKEQSLYTAKEETVLKGITRDKIIYCCNMLHIPVIETDIAVNDIKNYDGAFITGTSPKVLPLKQINSTMYYAQHTLIKEIQKEYDKLIDHEIARCK